MALFALQFPPGIYRNGTEYQSKNRWYDCNLVRFYEGTIRPIGGWRIKTTSTMTGVGRAITTWRDNSANTWAGIGTESHLYAMARTGVLSDITPSGFTPGRASATQGGGFGQGNFGAGTFGTPRADTSLIQDASVWTLDVFGQYLEACMADDGYIYEWQLNTGVIAAKVSNAPTARAIVCTDEGFVFALGAAGDPRNVAWCDQRDNTTWAPSATNQAGDYDLQTYGKLMCGKRVRGGTLIFTTLDVHLAQYTGDLFVYGFNKLADKCGVISQGSPAVIGDICAWMGNGNFWTYNGYVQQLPCDVSDYVFSNINAQQISKVTASVNTSYSEIRWDYPSAASNENDSFVVWNYRENHWTIGSMVRLSGTDRGPMLYPMMVGTDGNAYEHEVGFSYDGVWPYVESGPFQVASGPLQIGENDFVVHADALLPDDKTLGDVTATFKTKFYPDGPETSFGPYTLSAQTDLHFTARQAKVRYTGATLTDWRVGIPRLRVIAGGKR